MLSDVPDEEQAFIARNAEFFAGKTDAELEEARVTS